jgi:hypothetical protein
MLAIVISSPELFVFLAAKRDGITEQRRSQVKRLRDRARVQAGADAPRQGADP